VRARFEAALLGAGWLLFVAANLWLFQPFIWDNTKLIVWSALIFSGVTGWGLVRLAAARRWLAVLSAVVFTFTIWSGVLDLSWILQTEQHSYRMYSAQERRLAAWAQENTDPSSIWMTSDAPQHWVTNLAGRRSILSFRGWLWTHGYDYLDVERDLRVMYQQPALAQEQELYEQYGVDFMVLEPSARGDWGAREGCGEYGFSSLYQSNNVDICLVTTAAVQ
jgi:hypothetical protein